MHPSVTSRALLHAHNRRPPGYTVPLEFPMTQTFALLGVGGWQTQAPGNLPQLQEHCFFSTRCGRASVSSCSFESHKRQRRNDSSFVEHSVDQRADSHHGKHASVGVTLGANSVSGDAWTTTSLCAKSRRTPLLTRCLLASSLLTIGLAMIGMMLLANLWFWSTVLRPSSRRRGTRPIWPSLAGLTGWRESVLQGNVWTLVRSGFLDEDEGMRGDTSVRDPGVSLCLCSRPSSDVDTISWKSSSGECARIVRVLCGRRRVGARVPRLSSSVLTALRGT